jgi:Ca-activated chloride channel family protein
MRHCSSAVVTIVLTGAALSATAQLPKVPTVLIPVTVTTKQGIVTDLQKDIFRIYEGDTLQEIGSLAPKDAPISVGLLLDLSGSMRTKINAARESLLRFIQTSNPENEYFLIGFNDDPRLLKNFTTSIEDIRSSLATVVPEHRTALYDGIDLGLAKMKDARYERHVLLVVSDGADNKSTHTFSQVRTNSGSSNVQIYSIVIIDPYAATPEERIGPGFLSELSEETGGRMLPVNDIREMSGIAERISTELRIQYVISYTPRELPHERKWRKVKVKLNPPQGLPPLTVHARTGYYAPLQ